MVRNQEGIYEQTFNLVVMRKFLQENKAVADQVLNSAREAVSFIRTHEADAIEIIGRRSKMEEPNLRGIWSDHLFEVGLDDSLASQMTSQAEWARKNGIASDKKPTPAYTEYFYRPDIKK